MTKQLKFLTKEQKRQWDENGFIKVGNIFSPAELNEISDAYNELFERKAKENMGGLEAGWAGDEMKRAAKNIDYTVSLNNYTKKKLLMIFLYLKSHRIFIQ